MLRQRLLPQQLQFASFLEKSQAEIEEEIDHELAENPALERVEQSAAAPFPPIAAATSRPADDFHPLQEDNPPTLADHLAEQLNQDTELSATDRLLGLYIIGAIDSNGYLTRTVPELADDIMLESDGQLHPTAADVRRALAAVRALDPPGVAAMDLRECLALQLKRMDRSRPEVADALEIVNYYFDIFAQRNFKLLSAESGLSEARTEAAAEFIGRLNPKPGAAYVSDPARESGQGAVIPDFVVETDGETASVALSNSLPELQLEQSFRLENAPREAGEAQRFVADARSRATQFIDMLRRRQTTLLKIARAIVELQREFFTSGDDETRIRPMVLRDVAQRSGVELSGVSRAIKNKWLATAWGTYPLRHFFAYRGMSAPDDGPSTQAILACLRDIVDAENPARPLSDEEIAAQLRRQGYEVARRTVAKYRDRLNILPSRLRRK